MGVMIEGRYHTDDPAPDTAADGEFRRAASTVRHWITPDGPFTPDTGRYHLYAAWNCPWAHRALLARVFLGLEDAIGVTYARPRRTDQGWVYDADGGFADGCLGVSALHEVYARADPPYTGRITVPVLWDRKTGQIVSNESADIVRMLGAFGHGPDLLPAGLTPEIEDWNLLIYRTVNNGVYRAGFARTQAAYDSAVVELFETLDRIEAQLSRTEWLAGAMFTEADLRLFPTLARFDVAYHYALQVQHPKADRLPGALGLCATDLPYARGRRHSGFRDLQTGLFLTLGVAQSAGDRARRSAGGLVDLIARLRRKLSGTACRLGLCPRPRGISGRKKPQEVQAAACRPAQRPVARQAVSR